MQLRKQLRKPIPKRIELKVKLKNKRTCCVCHEYGKEILIHHIDGNPSNNHESNLAVLCLIHASEADASLRTGKLGAGKKLPSEEVRLHKKTWERKVKAETKLEKRNISIKDRKQLEILYKFEIFKRKNEILTFSSNQKSLILSNFAFIEQIQLDGILSDIKITQAILETYGDIALQSGGNENILVPLLDGIKNLFLYLTGTKHLKLSSHNRKYMLMSLSVIETVGMYATQVSDDFKSKVLIKLCRTIRDLADIGVLYNFNKFLEKVFRVLILMKKTAKSMNLIYEK
jgi:hypothetical protein